MALDYNPTTLGNIANETQFLNELNLNFSELATLLEDAVSRSGSAPNTWEADQDANSYDLNNLSVLTAARINTGSLFIDGAEIPSLEALRDLYALILEETKGAVLAVPDIAALRALTGVQDGQVVSVTGYHPGSDIGGGEFYYDASRAKADHNGGTVISPTVPWDGSQAALEDFLNGVGETDSGGAGCWVAAFSGLITPHRFGVVDAQESGAALEAFLSELGSTPYKDVSIECSTITDRLLTLDGSSGWKRVPGIFSISAGTDLRDDNNPNLLTLTNCSNWVFDGGFAVDGYRGFSNRRNIINGVSLQGCRNMHVDQISGGGGDGFLVDLDPSTNDNFATVNKITSSSFGFRPGVLPGLSYTFSSSDNAETSYFHRTTINIDLSTWPNDLLLSGFLYNGDRLQKIMAVDHDLGTATLWPGFESGYNYAEFPTADLIVGGALRTRGGDSGEFKFDAIVATNCGIGYLCGSLYGGLGFRLDTQSCGIGFSTLGASTSAVSIGTTLMQPYFENNTADVVSVSSAGGVTVISPIALRVARCWTLVPPANESNGNLSRIMLFGFYDQTPENGRWLNEQELYYVSSGGFTVDTARPYFINKSGGARVIRLRDNDRESGQGFKSRSILLRGYSPGLELIADEGFTINGQASVNLDSGVPDGTWIRAVLVGSDWKVWLYSGLEAGVGPSVFGASATYDPASLADGTSATTTVTVTGAALGDFATASFGADLQGVTLDAWVSAADTVSVKFTNNTGAAVDLASATLRARVEKA